MRIPIAFLNLMHGKFRTLVSTSGVALAIILIFMQIGFLGVVFGTATQIYDHLEFDILLRSPDYFYFCDARQIPRSYVNQVASMPEVESVRPLQVSLARWRVPNDFEEPTQAQKDIIGKLRGLVVMAIDPDEVVFDLPEIKAGASRLTNPDLLLVDQETKGDDYGAINGEVFGEDDNDRSVEINNRQFRIAGHFQLGAGLAAKGSVLMNESGFARIIPRDTINNVSYGLVRVKKGVVAKDFCQKLNQQFSESHRSLNGSAGTPPVDALTRVDVNLFEWYRWVCLTPIGAIFSSGVVVALVVGGVVVYMVLSNDVANHLSEYATLKAMGYSDGYLGRIVMQQALAMAILGYGVSLVCAEFLYQWVGDLANIPMNMNWIIRTLVFVLSVAMCCLSGLATLRKLRKAQPADLF